MHKFIYIILCAKPIFAPSLYTSIYIYIGFSNVLQNDLQVVVMIYISSVGFGFVFVLTALCGSVKIVEEGRYRQQYYRNATGEQLLMLWSRTHITTAPHEGQTASIMFILLPTTTPTEKDHKNRSWRNKHICQPVDSSWLSP